MSWLVDDGGQKISDGYPSETTFIDGPDPETLLADTWRWIPYSSDLSDYIRINPGPRLGAGRREWRVLYDEAVRPTENPKRPWSVALHLYGFVQEMHMGRTGDWDLTEDNAYKAVQSIKLGPGPADSPFEAQAQALSNVQRYIMGTIRGGGLSLEEQDDMLRKWRQSVHIGRRVFTKVKPGVPAAVYAAGPAARILNRWRIVDEPKIGQRQADSSVRPVPAALLSPGDFVQATVKFNVTVSEGTFRGRTVTNVSSRLELLAVVQLLDAREAREAFNVAPPSKNVDPADEEGEYEVEAVDDGVEFSFNA